MTFHAERTRQLLRRARLDQDLPLISDGRRALEILAQQPADRTEPGALLLLDMESPSVDARQLLRRIWNDPRLRHVPVVVLNDAPEEAGTLSDRKLNVLFSLPCAADVHQVLDVLRTHPDRRLLVAVIPERP